MIVVNEGEGLGMYGERTNWGISLALNRKHEWLVPVALSQGSVVTNTSSTNIELISETLPCFITFIWCCVPSTNGPSVTQTSSREVILVSLPISIGVLVVQITNLPISISLSHWAEFKISIAIGCLADHLTHDSDERMQKTSDLVTRPGTATRLQRKFGKLLENSLYFFEFVSYLSSFFWNF